MGLFLYLGAGKSVERKLTDLLQPVVESVGCELWGVEYHPRNSLLRLYIEKASGVLLDDCEKVSREVRAVLDTAKVMSDDYGLEVSSPGLNRRFFSAEQCARFVGDKISLRLRERLGQSKRVEGVLTGVDADTVCMQVAGDDLRIPFASVSKARRLPE